MNIFIVFQKDPFPLHTSTVAKGAMKDFIPEKKLHLIRAMNSFQKNVCMPQAEYEEVGVMSKIM